MNLRMRISNIAFVLLLALVMVLALNHRIQAQQGDLYQLTGSVVAGGTTTAGSYQTDAAIGQATIALNTTGPYELGSGFWGGGLVVRGIEELQIFLPLILR
ncbi:MAG: hypothetical protein GY943_26900 [Chloroflexi bacterium]|nr:hypothetical protein [Chloroflexota bacterium]